MLLVLVECMTREGDTAQPLEQPRLSLTEEVAGSLGQSSVLVQGY